MRSSSSRQLTHRRKKCLLEVDVDVEAVPARGFFLEGTSRRGASRVALPQTAAKIFRSPAMNLVLCTVGVWSGCACSLVKGGGTLHRIRAKREFVFLLSIFSKAVRWS